MNEEKKAIEKPTISFVVVAVAVAAASSAIVVTLPSLLAQISFSILPFLFTFSLVSFCE